MMKDIFLRVYQRPLLMEQQSYAQEAPNEEQEEEQYQQYPYNHMNPIGEDEELEEEEDEDEVVKHQQDPEGVELVGDEAEDDYQ
jgi:hypothetical protein